MKVCDKSLNQVLRFVLQFETSTGLAVDLFFLLLLFQSYHVGIIFAQLYSHFAEIKIKSGLYKCKDKYITLLLLTCI